MWFIRIGEEERESEKRSDCKYNYKLGEEEIFYEYLNIKILKPVRMKYITTKKAIK